MGFAILTASSQYSVRAMKGQDENITREDQGKPRGMTRDEIIAAEPLSATEHVPEDLLRECRRIDGFELGREHGLLRP